MLLNVGVRDKRSHGDAHLFIYWGEKSIGESDTCEDFQEKLLSD